MQIGGTGAHVTGIGGILDEALDRKSRLAQVFIQLGLYPVERGEIDVFLQPHARASPLKGGCDAPREPTTTPDASLERPRATRSEEHTSELQSLMRISYAVFCLKKKTYNTTKNNMTQTNEYCTPFYTALNITNPS